MYDIIIDFIIGIMFGIVIGSVLFMAYITGKLSK